MLPATGGSNWELLRPTALKALVPPLIGPLSCHSSLLYWRLHGSASTHGAVACAIQKNY